MTQDIYPPPRAPGLMDVVYFTNVDDGGYFNKADYPGAQSVRVRAQGGGAAGVTPNSTRSGGGGGGGAYAESLIDIGSLASTETVTVGAGSLSNGTQQADISAGGVSSFGALVIADGARNVPGTSYVGGSGGLASESVGDVVVEGGDGGSGGDASSIPGGQGGHSHLGGGGRGSRGINPAGGLAGNPYGGGGGGGTAGTEGGAGADGIVIVEVYSTYAGNTGDFATRSYVERPGTVVQTVNALSGTSQVEAGDVWTSGDLSVTITPRYNDSLLIVRAHVQAFANRVNGQSTAERRGRLRLYNVTDAVALDGAADLYFGRTLVAASGVDSPSQGPQSLEGHYTVNSLTQRQFRLEIQKTSAECRTWLTHQLSRGVITVQEVRA